jgi:hypothetical protein
MKTESDQHNNLIIIILDNNIKRDCTSECARTHLLIHLARCIHRRRLVALGSIRKKYKLLVWKLGPYDCFKEVTKQVTSLLQLDNMCIIHRTSDTNNNNKL